MSLPLLRTWWGRLAAHAIVAGLLVQMVGVALHFGPAPPAAAETDVHSFRTVLICSASGLRAITLDDQDNVADAPLPADPAKSGHACPLCLALGGCALAAPVDVASIRAPATSVEIAWSGSEVGAGSRAVLLHRNRGPPLTTIV